MHENFSHSPRPQASSPVDDLSRIFNTALVGTRTEGVRDLSAELFSLVESPAFRAILSAVRQTARTEGISEREAAEEVIRTFRKVDRIWETYILQEGVDRLRAHAPISS
jgi:hypothetical protein